MNRLIARTLPFQTPLRRRLGRSRKMAEAAVSSEVLQPEESTPVDPIVLPGELDRAREGVEGFSTLEEARRPFEEKVFHHSPVVRYELENCLVHPGGVEFSGGAIKKTAFNRFETLSAPIVELPRACYAMNYVSNRFFGHWLQDSCATALLARTGEELILDLRPDWPHTAEYAAAFGFAPRRERYLFVRRLAVFSDRAQGSSKAARYVELRRRLDAAFAGTAMPAADVYLRRGASGVARPVANEDAVIAALTARGFEVCDHAGTSIADLYARFRNARCVVSMEGSQQNHLQYLMPTGALMLSLTPDRRFTAVQMGYAQATGLRYGLVVAEGRADGYHVDLERLQATLDLAGVAG